MNEMKNYKNKKTIKSRWNAFNKYCEVEARK